MMVDKLQSILDSLRNLRWMKVLTKTSNVYLVGGSVRDAYLGKEIKDFDLVVEGLTLDEVKKMLSPLGKVNIVGESFSVIKFRPTGWIGEDFDIAVPRMDRKIGSSHKDFKIITDNVSIESDLKRRDFTINSIAVNVLSGTIIDPYGGLLDLKNKIIRATDFDAFAEDPLRILRAVQFSARLDFSISKQTKEMMRIYSHELTNISSERILEEFMKIINKGGNINAAINLMYDTDIDIALFHKKMKDTNMPDKMDVTSFFYNLGRAGDVDPFVFYTKNLKGEYLIGKAIKQMMRLMEFDLTKIAEDKLRYEVFCSVRQSPLVLNVTTFPFRISSIIDEMIVGSIPTHPSHIRANGDDVLFLSPDTDGKIVGEILAKLYTDALMKSFDWRSRKESLERVHQLTKCDAIKISTD